MTSQKTLCGVWGWAVISYLIVVGIIVGTIDGLNFNRFCLFNFDSLWMPKSNKTDHLTDKSENQKNLKIFQKYLKLLISMLFNK